jgi:hypothetical protein
MSFLRRFFIFSGLLSPFTVVAQSVSVDSGKPWESLAVRLENSVKGIDAAKLPQANSYRQKLLDAIAGFERDLDTGGKPEVLQSWQRYLKFEDLREKLAVPENGKLDYRELATHSIKLADRLTRYQPGMERREHVRLRTAARELSQIAQMQPAEQSLKSLDGQIKNLAKLLREQTSSELTPEACCAASFILTYLQVAGQLPEIQFELRQRFNQANVQTHLSAAMFTKALESPVSKSGPVDECILGTRVIGTSNTTGSVRGELLPSSGDFRIALRMETHVTSNSIGYSYPVKVHTNSNAAVLASKLLVLSEQGIRAEPAVAEADLRSNIRGIEHPLRIVRRIASKKAAEKQPQSVAVAKGLIEAETTRSFNEQVDQQLSQRKPSPLLQEVNRLLNSFGLPEPSRYLHSDGKYARVFLHSGERWQACAPRAAPEFPSDMAATLQIHESAVDNAAATIFAGRTYKGKQFEDLFDSLAERLASGLGTPKRESGKPTNEETKNDNEEAQQDKEEPPIEIQFHTFRPIIFEAREGKLRVGLHGVKFTSGNRSIEKEMTISATYQPKVDGRKTWLQREGDAEISFGRERLSIRESALRTVIKRQLADRFPEQILHRKLEIPSQLKKAVGPLTVRWIDAKQGWLSIGLK